MPLVNVQWSSKRPYAWQIDRARAYKALFDLVRDQRDLKWPALAGELNANAKSAGVSNIPLYTGRVLQLYAASPTPEDDNPVALREPQGVRLKHLYEFLKQQVQQLEPSQQNQLNLAMIQERREWPAQHQEYWQIRRCEIIPTDLWNQIDAKLGACKLVTKARDQFNAPSKYFMSRLGNVQNEFWGVSSVFEEQWLDAVIQMALKKPPVKVDLVFNRDVSDRVRASLSTKGRLKLVERRLICWQVNEWPDIDYGGIAGSESFTALYLGLKQSPYLNDCLLVGEDKDAIGWGKALFQYHKAHSHQGDSLS